MKFRSELILQRNTRDNLDLFDLEHITSEFQHDNLRFDTLAFDNDNKSFVIIEYKNKLDFKVLNQGETYYNLLLDNKDIYIDKYNAVFKTNLNETYFDFDKTKVMIIGPKFSPKQIEAAKSPHYPFEIWKVNLDKNCCITYENISTNEIKELQVTENDLILTEDELLKNRSEKMTELYYFIKNRILHGFPNVNERILIDAFSFRENDNLICKFKFLKNSFKVFFYTSEIKDTQDRLEDISNKN